MRSPRNLALLCVCAAGCMLNGDALKERVRAALLECTGDDPSSQRCTEVAGSAADETKTRAAAASFREACGDIREVQVDDATSVLQKHDSDDGWAWEPGCAVGRVTAERCNGRFRFDIGLTRPGPAIGPVDVVTLVDLERVSETETAGRLTCPRDERGVPIHRSSADEK